MVFFATYNIYIVDHSLINLRIALNQAAEARTLQDFERIRLLLKVPIFREVAKETFSPREFTSMEMAENISATAKGPEQIKDINYFLKETLRAKEEQRGAFLAFFDKLNARIFKPVLQEPKKELEANARKLEGRIRSSRDSKRLQALYYELGNVYMQLSDLLKSERAFMQAIEAAPGSKIAKKSKFNLAWAYKSLGEPEKAIALFSELSKEYAAEGQAEAADTYYKGGRYLESRDKYARIFEQYPAFDIADLALYEAGYISIYNLDDRGAAAQYLALLEEKFPGSSIVRHVTKEIRPEMAKVYRLAGYKLLREKKYDEAINNFVMAVDIAPADGTSLAGMGLGFYWLNNFEDALQKARKALQVVYDDGYEDEVTITNYLFICISIGKLDEAIGAGEDALKKVKIYMPEFYYNLGIAYVGKGEMSSALRNFDRAISLNPSFIFAYNNLGCLLWATSKYSDGIQMFKRALDINNEYGDAHYNLGVAYFYSNQMVDSYREFEKSLQIDPDYDKARNYLNRITGSLGYQP